MPRFPLITLLTLILCLSGLTFSGCSSAKEATQSSSTASSEITKGQSLFQNNCVSCHQGAGDPPGPDGAILGSGMLEKENGFRSFLRNPSSGMMPAFQEGQLSDDEVRSLYLYIQSVRSGS